MSIFKPKLFCAKDLQTRHPYNRHYSTDTEYANIANKLVMALLKVNTRNVTMKEVLQYSLVITLYFEDVVADAGIWRSFVQTHKQMYGRLLPFYDVDEDSYMADEPHVEDIKLLLWLTRMWMSEGKIPNPNNPVFEAYSSIAFNILDDNFEKVGINEELADELRDADALEDPSNRLNMLKWIYSGCYLTASLNNENLVKDMAKSIQMGKKSQRLSMAYNTACHTNRCGPLALFPQEWLAMIFETNGKAKAAKDIRNIKYLAEMTVHCTGINGDSCTLKTSAGQEFSINKKEVGGNLMKEGGYVLASFARYKEQWMAMNAFLLETIAGEEHFGLCKQAILDERSKHTANYERLMEISGGSPLFYFADETELKNFFFRHGVLDKEDMASRSEFFERNKDAKNYVAFCQSADSEFVVAPNAASYIKDERNPFYNAEEARTHAMDSINNLSGEMVCYLIANNMLPDAALHAAQGYEYGNRIVQQFFDFIARAYMQNGYGLKPLLSVALF